MTKRQYAQEIANIVNGEVTNVDKANGIRLTGIMVKGESNVAPTVYIDEMYKRGVSVEEAAQEVKYAIESHQIPEMDMSFIYDFSQIEGRLRARLYNKATKAEVYQSAEEYGFDDLIIIPIIDLSDLVPTGSTKVNKTLLAHWELDASEVIEVALANSAREATMQSMAAIMAAMMGMDPDAVPFPDDGTMVLTTESQAYGAIAVIAKAKELAERFPNGYVVLPSSVHEVIVRELDAAIDEYSNMVQSVNATQVDPEEQLINHAYVVNAA